MPNNPLKLSRLFALLSLAVMLVFLLGGNSPGSALAETRFQPAKDGQPDSLDTQQNLPLHSAFLSASEDAPLGSHSGATSAPGVTTTPTPCTGWNVVSSPNVGSGDNFLFSSAALGAGDIWAVGFYHDQTNRRQTLVEHWDGSSWSIVPSPNMGTGSNFLRAVVAPASSDIWAVGHWVTGALVSQTLVEHWDGSSWSIVPSPNMGPYDNEFLGEAMVSANDIWAVGNYWGGTAARTLTEHWNGTDWSIVPSPNVGTGHNNLVSVAARAGNDVWAAGVACGASGCGSSQALVEHWDGSSWSVVPSPDTGGVYSVFWGLAARASNDVWAVGTVCLDSNCVTARSLIEHWDGSSWSIVPSPNPGSVATAYYAVTALAANDAWATGSYTNDNTTFRVSTIHWDGTSWTYVPVSSEGTLDNDLRALVAVGPAGVWAVGDFDSGSGERTQVQHYTGPCSTATPSPSSTSTKTPTPLVSTTVASSTPSGTTVASSTPNPSSTSTKTPTPLVSNTIGVSTPSGTTVASSTPTSTACTVTFIDVPNPSTFYPYILCLACRGIINGYPDNTFRPNNNVTRGQLSKIISNAAGFNDPQTTQMFQDVPVGSTFFDFIGRLASRGYIGGYPCGGVGEPCVPPANLPYFRPNNNATRGQISKIDSNAAGFSDTPAGHQFEDVAVGSTYYTYTYRLVSRSIMAGYPCGGAGEPCNPPLNLPYFRPNANATKGQTSKIVANTFYPNCQTPARR